MVNVGFLGKVAFYRESREGLHLTYARGCREMPSKESRKKCDSQLVKRSWKLEKFQLN